jgi:cob(I)alamin adenosyltransferase
VKIYTRTGDDGSTGLIGKGRVPKDATRVEAYGAVDELNATLGVARAADGAGWFAADLEAIQTALLVIGAELATPGPAPATIARVGDDEIAALERRIDALDEELPALTRFVLPGGTPLAAALHVSRTVCRRAERRVVSLARAERAHDGVIRYLNRLADLLFTMARASNRRAGVADHEWTPAPR